ncbi:FixH family protein [Pseudenhygromyxa sp. WMMC2535]|uniref:FixH family protein n=1 Tax=Pseudenhygromyxa sp. WMMC2535 TaxID=2712867 RepID=UPI00155299DD|nr:FixH family protein [Pseudenhygromyxa sp. WMMC2535]NVB40598.1 FixH family protein [Pseudenhygromyxa sp. WMMC2535]
MNDAAPTPAPGTAGSRSNLAWPIGIVVGLGIVLVANAIMITVAVSHPSVPAAEDHWRESMDWDRELEAREASAALGWTMGEFTRSDEGALEMRILDAAGEPLPGLAGELRLERADDASRDASLTLVDLGEGRYRSQTSAPERGLVRLELDVHDAGGRRFVASRNVELDALELDALGPDAEPE